MSKYPFTYICLRGNHEERAKNMMDLRSAEWEIRQKYGGEIYDLSES